MQWFKRKYFTFITALKYLVAGDELDALERYREACHAMQSEEPINQRCRHTAQWIQRHGESMHSEIGSAIHLEIGRKTREALNSTLIG